jgi:hypothetical protein
VVQNICGGWGGEEELRNEGGKIDQDHIAKGLECHAKAQGLHPVDIRKLQMFLTNIYQHPHLTSYVPSQVLCQF